MVQARTATARVIIGVATLLGCFSALQAYQYVLLFAEKKQPFLKLLGLNLGYWYGWAALAPVVLWLARRFPFDRHVWRRSLPVHLVAVVVVTFAHVVLSEGTYLLVMGSGSSMANVPFWTSVQRTFFRSFDWEMATYWALIGLSHAVSYYHQAQDRTLRALQLETRLAEAQLQALQRQLHPHFLFNTLNAISALMHRDVNAADQMLARLSDLLRMALDQPGAQEIPLKDELEFLEKYLEIEQTRFGDRLTVRFDVEPETLDALVPNLVLQPLVENSIRHAIGPRIEPGTIAVRARRAGAMLDLRVIDNGPGLRPATRPGAGVGLANTRLRLEHLYGAAGQLVLSEPPDGGLVAAVTLPFRSDIEDHEDHHEPDAEHIKGVA
jgi:two-component system LytT family sensor kinase